MLVERYRPKSLKELADQGKAKEEFSKAVSGWKPGKVIVLHGPPGVGKTSMVLAYARENGFRVVTVDPDFPESVPMNELGASSSLFGEKKIILFDDIDLMERGQEAAIEVASRSAFPVVATATDIYRLKKLRKVAVPVKLGKVPSRSVFSLLKKICESEGLDVPETVLKEISSACDGDVRSAVNDLELASAGGRFSFRDRPLSVFDTLRIVLKTRSLEAARDAVRRCEKPLNELILWFSENVWREYEDPEEVWKAYEFLALADLFLSRIPKNQNFRLMVYASEFLSLISAAKKEPYRKFTKFASPFSRFSLYSKR